MLLLGHIRTHKNYRDPHKGYTREPQNTLRAPIVFGQRPIKIGAPGAVDPEKNCHHLSPALVSLLVVLSPKIFLPSCFPRPDSDKAAAVQ